MKRYAAAALAALIALATAACGGDGKSKLEGSDVVWATSVQTGWVFRDGKIHQATPTANTVLGKENLWYAEKNNKGTYTSTHLSFPEDRASGETHPYTITGDKLAFKYGRLDWTCTKKTGQKIQWIGK